MRSLGICRGITCLALLCSVASAAFAGDGRAIVAVMEIEDNSERLSAEDVNAATDYLRGRLTATGKYIVIDKTRQARALENIVSGAKADSYRECKDKECQIPLGQALSADSILRCSIIYLGGVYSIQAELVDLSKEAAVKGAMVDFEEKPGVPPVRSLVTVLRALVAQLVEDSNGNAVTPTTPEPAMTPAPAPPPMPVAAALKPTPEANHSPEKASVEPVAPEANGAGVELSTKSENAADDSNSGLGTGGWITVLAGVGLAGAGGYFINESYAENSEIETRMQGEEKKPRNEAEDDFQAAQNKNIVGLALAGVGATAILGAILYSASSTDASDELAQRHGDIKRSRAGVGALTPTISMTPQGVNLGVGGRF